MDKKNLTNEPKQDEVADIDNVEIQPLADEDLDSVVGGMCSVAFCSNKAAQLEAN